MNYLLNNKMNTIARRSSILLVALLLISLTGISQNINIPNKTGPMGLEVNSYTGNLYFDRTDFVIEGTGLNMTIKFAYNSYNLDINRGFGNGWNFEYDVHYRTDGNDMIIVWGDGQEDLYKSLGNGEFKSPVGYFSILKEYEPGKYSLTKTNGTRLLFENNTSKQVTKIDDPNGNFMMVHHTDSLVTSLSNNYGQTVQFIYNNKGFLEKVTDALASPVRSWTYNYDGLGSLVSVTDPLGGKDSYSYMINGPIKSVSDKNFNVVDIVYYNDFSVREMVGCNKHISFSYDTTQKMTVVTEHMESGINQVSKYYYKVFEKRNWLVGISGNCCGFDVQIEYDNQGNKIKQTDANGNTTKYSYDTRGNVLSETNALGQVTTLTYHPDRNLITSITDHKGHKRMFEYDNKGNLIKLTEADNSIYTASYDANGNMISMSDPGGQTFNYTYDAYGNIKTLGGPEGLNAAFGISPRNELLTYTNPHNNSQTYAYDIMGRMTEFVDPLSNKSKFGYDAMGNMIVYRNKKDEKSDFKYDASNRLREIVNPLDNRTTIGYDGMNNITSVTDAAGGETIFKFNDRDLVSAIIDAEGNETTFSYDREGNMITKNTPSGQTLSFTYDALKRVTAISDANGLLSNLEYDANGNASKFTDITGASSNIEYDDRNRIKKLIDPLGNSIELSYYENGKVKTLRNKNGQVTTYTYDGLGRVKTMTDNIGGTTKVTYDAVGNILSLTDANNNVTSYIYDALKRVTKETFPDGKYTEYSYDPNNNVVSSREKDGSISTYSYDSLSRLKTKTLSDGNVLSYDYDAAGKVIAATNNNGTIHFSYDFLNRIKSQTFNGRVITYDYDIASKRQTIKYPDNSEIVRNYDDRNRLVSIQKDNQVVVTYQYNNYNQVTSKSYSNGITTNFQYDFTGRLTSLMTGNIQDISFTYDNFGNKTSVVRGNSNNSEFLTYDNANRLKSYKKGKAGGPFTVDDSYNYDALGNRASATIGGKNISYTTNNLNQLLTLNDGTKTIDYVYDERGNLTYDGKYFKTYNVLKQVITDSASPGEVIHYKYDAFGRNISKTVNGITSNFTFSGISPLEELDANGVLKNKIIYKGNMEPLMNEKNGVPYYYHQNDLFSITAMTDNSGNLIESYQYDIFGKQTIYDGSGNMKSGSTTGNRFGFTGQVYDSATKENRFYFRNYNPETGTFNQQDLIGYNDGMNLYHYTHNNPGSMIDPLGLAPCPPKPEVQVSMQEKIMNWVDYLGAAAGSADLILAKTAENTYVILKGTATGAGSILSIIGGANSTAQLASNYSTNDAATNVDLAAGATMSFTGVGLTLASAAAGTPVGAGAAAGMTIYAIINTGSKVLTGKSAPEHLYPISDAIGDAWATEFYENAEFNKNYGWLLQTQGYERAELYARIYKEKVSKRIYKGNPCPENNKPHGTQRPPHGPKNPGSTGSTEIIRSDDPNEIIGPEGQPDKRWVSVNDRLPYTVTYENSEMATAPAKYIKVIVPVDKKMDPATFQLSNLGFNNMTFNVPPMSPSNYQRLDVRDSLGLWIDMTAGFDQMKNEFFWEFQSIDPVTLMPPADPLKGFLLTQDTTEIKSNNGHGFVNFSVKPVGNAQTLDSVLAFASIVFDQNDTIPTNIEKNVIDAVGPTSQLSQLDPAYTNTIPLSWSGQDDPKGSGVRSYTLYVSTDGTNYSIVRSGITRTDTTFTGLGSTTYYFFVLATDSVGNIEKLRPGAVVNTYLGSVLPVTWLYFKGSNRNKDNVLEWATANERNTKEYQVERSFDAQNFTGIGKVKAAGSSTGNSSYQYTDYDVDRLGEPVMYYRLAQTDIDGRVNYSNVVRLNYISKGLKKTIVYPNPTRGVIVVVPGDPTLIGTVAKLYDEAGKLLQSVKITSANQQFNLGSYTNGIYFIKLANEEVLKIMKH